MRLHLPKLWDRFVQNLRRAVGYDVQYFAVIEPQRRLAPHIHAAIRGAIPRKMLRQVIAATYAAVWWPAHDRIVYAGDRIPVWDSNLGGYVDPDNAMPLRTWDEALDELDDQGEDAEPRTWSGSAGRATSKASSAAPTRRTGGSAT